jgi:hypothetical protein
MKEEEGEEEEEDEEEEKEEVKQHIKCTTLNPPPATFIHCIEIEPCKGGQQVALPNSWDSIRPRHLAHNCKRVTRVWYGFDITDRNPVHLTS